LTPAPVDPQPARERSATLDRLARLVTPFLILALLVAGLEVYLRVVVDDGMNFDLEMWKYAKQIKQRSSDPLIGHEHRPLAHAHLMGVDIDTNSFGHRDREIPIARQPGIPRIVMIGDSFIEGWGVPFDQTISKRLERLFLRDGRTVEVMNTGVGNSGSVQEVERFLQRDARFNPDLAVLNFDFRSAIPVPRYGYSGWLVQHSEALVFLTSGSDALQRLFGARKHWDQDYLTLFDGPGWPAAKASIHRLAEYCRQHRIQLVIANWPELHDVQHYRLGRITALIRQTAADEQVPFVDLLEAVKDQDSAKLWVTPPDPHPNGYANKLYAEYLFPLLRQLLPTTDH
jgi:GDSL-like lipase/acylhydrolase family protein